MSKDYIRLSPEHGLNPTIPVCMFCGKDKDMIALMGKVGKRGEDKKMPMRCVIDYEPCDECKEGMKQGIALIEVTSEQPEDMRPEICKGGYPTGNMVVLKDSAVERIFEEDAKPLIEKRMGFIESGLFKHLMGGVSQDV